MQDLTPVLVRLFATWGCTPRAYIRISSELEVGQIPDTAVDADKRGTFPPHGLFFVN